MTLKLAVFTAQVGKVSETFIRRHIEDLFPRRTVVVALWSGHERCNVPCPAFYIDRWQLGLPVRLARRAGLPEGRLRAAALGRFLQRHGVNIVLGEYLDQ